jgi:tetratricopeptide (TPR) repeat protein
MLNIKLNSKFFTYKTLVWAVAFTVALITTLVYLSALQNDFVNWDDHQYVYTNHYIQSMDFEFFKWMFTTFHASNWHPLTWLSHTIDYAIWGLNPTGHHLTSIILHGLNTFLVVLLITRLVNYANPPLPPFTEGGLRGITQKGNHTSIIAGVVTGLLFGLHPLHVESVAWVSERKDVLYAFFFLLSILSYLKYTSLQKQGLSGHSSPVTRHRWYFLCLIFFILSLMSKPMAVTLPILLLILDVYPLRRLEFKTASYNPPLPPFSKGGRGGIKVLIEKLPFIVLSLASSVITIIAQKVGGAITPLETSSLTDRILIAFRALCFYLFKMIWPSNLAPLYPYPSKISFLSLDYIGSFTLVTTITISCIYLWYKGKQIWSAVWTYYVITLLPVLGIVRIGAQAAADRYTYLPSLGPFLLVGLSAALLWERVYIKKHDLMLRKSFILIPLVLILVPLCATTVKQIKIWKDGITLWNTELKLFPDSSVAHKNRGVAQDNIGNYRKAIEDYSKAIKLNPLYAEAYVNRGIVYAKSGRYQEAIENFNMAIMINPKAIFAFYNRGLYYKRLGEYQGAIKDFDTAIGLDSQYIAAYLNRGDLYAKLGNHQKAIEDFNRVIELFSRNAEAYNKRGIAYRNLGHYHQAIQDFNNAIKFRPQYIEAYNNRGGIYAIIGRYQQAIKDFDMAIKLNPKAVDVYVNRGMFYLNLGNDVQAIQDFQTAARMDDKQSQDYLKSKGIEW